MNCFQSLPLIYKWLSNCIIIFEKADKQICNKCLTPIVLLSLYQSRYNPLFNITLVCFNPDTTLFVFFSMYRLDSFRYNSQSNLMFSNNTLVCINPDKTLSVFFSMYRSDSFMYYSLSNSMFSNNTLVCIIQIQIALELNVRAIMLQYVPIQIQHSLYSLVCIVQVRSFTTHCRTQCPTNNTLVCIIQIQHSLELNVRAIILQYVPIQIQHSMYSLVCINPDTNRS